MEPEFCVRKTRVFASNGGCSNTADSCFRFSAGSFESENSTNSQQPPENILPVSRKLVQQTAQTQGVHAAGGYLKNSKRTWGICLPEKSPQAQLEKMQSMAANLKSVLEESSNEDQITSLLQRVETGTVSETEFIGYILQIPAIVGMVALFIVAFLVVIPLSIAQLAVALVSSILLILGPLGRFLRWIVFLPLCLVGAVLSIAFGIVFLLLFLVYGLGTLLGGGKLSVKEKKQAAKKAADSCSLGWHLGA